MRMSRRAVVAGMLAVPVVGGGVARAAEPINYGGFRLVKTRPSAPTTPEVILSPGYELSPTASHRFASRGEFYAYVRGPRSAAVDVTVRWPGERVKDIVTHESRVPFTRNGDETTFQLPVNGGTSANQGTVQVFSYHHTAPGTYWRIEHNQADRAAGYWSTVAWPKGEADAAINLLVACEAILVDSGLAAEAARRGHFYALMGFETNNLMHLDNPPHWHLSYYPGPDFGAPRASVPHFWLDAQGKTFYNGMDVQGLPPRQKYYVGDPAPIYDAQGTLIVTLTIRADGGLDITPPGGEPYSITPDRDGTLSSAVRLLKHGAPWRRIVSDDNVDEGLTTWTMSSLRTPTFHRVTRAYYDPLTGVLQRTVVS